VRRARVLDRVAERLLGDAIEIELDLLRHRVRGFEGAADRDLRPAR